MNNKKIPDIETRKKSVSRLKEACLMLDALNMTLDEAEKVIAIANSINAKIGGIYSEGISTATYGDIFKSKILLPSILIII